MQYEIFQNERNLTTPSMIQLSQYENKICSLHFNYNQDFGNGVKYITLFNKLYDVFLMDKIVNDTIEVTSAITRYDGDWGVILLVLETEDAYKDGVLDHTKCIYVSHQAQIINVEKNFLSEIIRPAGLN